MMDFSREYFAASSVKVYTAGKGKPLGYTLPWVCCGNVVAGSTERVSVALGGRGMVYALLETPIRVSPLCILHLHLYPKPLPVMEGNGEDVGPGNSCRRSEGEENVACGQIPSNYSPSLIMELLPAHKPQVKAEHLPQLAGREARHRPRLSNPLNVGGGGGGRARS